MAVVPIVLYHCFAFLTTRTMTGCVDEETPLLAENGKKQKTPLPWSQFTIVWFLQLVEPLTSNVIYPFTPQVCSLLCSKKLINLLLWISQSSFAMLVSHTARRVKWDIMSVSWCIDLPSLHLYTSS